MNVHHALLQEDPVVIASAVRTPVGSLQGCLAEISATQLGSIVIREAVERSGLALTEVDQVVMGCVLTAGLGQAPARQASLDAGVPVDAGAFTVNKVCGSGMQAIMLLHDALYVGSACVGVAGGMESMSRAPFLLGGVRAGLRTGHQHMLDHLLYDGLEDHCADMEGCGTPMGILAEACAERFGFDRSIQDSYARTSLERALAAWEQGWFEEEICDIDLRHAGKGLDPVHRDDRPFRLDPNRITDLEPVFKEGGTVTAASASALADGAAALVMMRLSEAKRRNVRTAARIVGHATCSTEPAWFSLAPTGAIRKLLLRTGWSVEDVDLYEINEAFAVVALTTISELNLDLSKVNVHGGALALGHPIGASGTRLLVSLMTALRRTGGRRGIATICIGGGEATAIAIELSTCTDTL